MGFGNGWQSRLTQTLYPYVSMIDLGGDKFFWRDIAANLYDHPLADLTPAPTTAMSELPRQYDLIRVVFHTMRTTYKSVAY